MLRDGLANMSNSASASEMTYVVSGGALNCILTSPRLCDWSDLISYTRQRIFNVTLPAEQYHQ